VAISPDDAAPGPVYQAVAVALAREKVTPELANEIVKAFKAKINPRARSVRSMQPCKPFALDVTTWRLSDSACLPALGFDSLFIHHSCATNHKFPSAWGGRPLVRGCSSPLTGYPGISRPLCQGVPVTGAREVWTCHAATPPPLTERAQHWCA
jgi:hypothetical protein